MSTKPARKIHGEKSIWILSYHIAAVAQLLAEILVRVLIESGVQTIHTTYTWQNQVPSDKMIEFTKVPLWITSSHSRVIHDAFIVCGYQITGTLRPSKRLGH